MTGSGIIDNAKQVVCELQDLGTMYSVVSGGLSEAGWELRACWVLTGVKADRLNCSSWKHSKVTELRRKLNLA